MKHSKLARLLAGSNRPTTRQAAVEPEPDIVHTVHNDTKAASDTIEDQRVAGSVHDRQRVTDNV
jgi:hypothetical protein